MLAGYTLIRPGPARDFVQKGPREGGGSDANFNLAINRPESARLTGGESLLGVDRVNICKVGIHPENQKTGNRGRYAVGIAVAHKVYPGECALEQAI